jgi:hypothetical protein
VGLGLPRARRRLARGGVKPSSEAEALWRDAWSSSEGYPDRPFGGPPRLLGPWALLFFGPRPRGAFFVVCGFVHLLLIIFRQGFSRLLGDPYGCP